MGMYRIRKYDADQSALMGKLVLESVVQHIFSWRDSYANWQYYFKYLSICHQSMTVFKLLLVCLS